MKALIISDDKEIIEIFENFLTKENIETITYNWFLKALDNIEEIKPDLIIINGEEYPRHWKILSQFAKSNITGKKIPVFVYTSMNLNEDDENKIKTLKNTIILNSVKDSLLMKLTEKYNLSEIEDKFVAAVDDAVNSSENLDTVETICNSVAAEVTDITDNIGDTKEVTEEFLPDTDQSAESLMNGNPIVLRALINSNVNKKIVIGSLVFNTFEDMKVKFIPDYEDDLALFTKDSSVHDAFYEYEKDCIHFNARVLDIKKDEDKSVEMEFLE